MMLIKNQDLDIPEDDPWKNDCLGRKPFAEKLISLISTLKQPFVISLHSPWGTGKTEFIRMLNQEIQNRGFASFYFNAWENDLSDDPLFNFIGEISANSSQILKDAGHSPTRAELGSKIKEIVKNLAAPAVRILTRNTLDLEEIKSILTVSDEDKKDISKHLGELAQKKLAGHDDKKKALAAFRENLSDLRKTLDIYEVPTPTVFFIDELDRCRPDYAIKLLESIKHLFNVDGYLFVLSVDKTQLENIVHSMFGTSTEASPYLKKFIDFEINLPTSNTANFFEYLLKRMHLDDIKANEDTRFYSYFKYCFTTTTEHFNLSLREQCQIFTNLKLLFSILNQDKYTLHHSLLPHILTMRMKNNHIFSRIARKEIEFSELTKQHDMIPPGLHDDNIPQGYARHFTALYKCHLMNRAEFDTFINTQQDTHTANVFLNYYSSQHLKQIIEMLETFTVPAENQQH